MEFNRYMTDENDTFFNRCNTVCGKLFSYSISCFVYHCSGRPRFTLRRCLGKLFILHQRFSTLLKLTSSYSFAPFLKKPLTIKCVPGIARTISIDLGFESVRSAVAQTNRFAHSSVTKETHDLVSKVHRAITNKETKRPSAYAQGDTFQFTNTWVHCECALLVYLHQNNIPAEEHIGISKLWCYGCYVFFNAYNLATDRSYTAEGTHGKIYIPYVFPLVEFYEEDPRLSGQKLQDLDHNIYTNMQQVLRQKLKADIKTVPAALESDSSGASQGNVMFGNENVYTVEMRRTLRPGM